MPVYFTVNLGRKVRYSSWRPLNRGSNVKCQMFVYSGHALSYTKLVHRHATQTEGNKYFK